MRSVFSLVVLGLLLCLVPAHASERAPIYHAIEPAFVVNVQDGNRPRFMQVKIQVMTHNKQVIDHLQNNLPPIRHAMIMLLSSQAGDTMRSAPGREAVRAQALEVMRETLAEVAGVQDGLEALYFTDLVIQ